jgi:phasin
MASSPKKSSVVTDAEPVAPSKKAVVPRVEAPSVESAPLPDLAKAAAEVSPALASTMADAAKIFSSPAASVADAQEKVRAMFEKGLTETRATYSKAKSVADEASNAMETSYTNAKSGIMEINVKALEVFRANADANFDFLKSIFQVKSATDFVTLQAEFTRKQVEMLAGQTKELGALAQKVASDAVEPLKAQAAKTFKIAV